MDAGALRGPLDEVDETEISGCARVREVFRDGLRDAAPRKDELAEGKDDDGQRDERRPEKHASRSLRSTAP